MEFTIPLTRIKPSYTYIAKYEDDEIEQFFKNKIYKNHSMLSKMKNHSLIQKVRNRMILTLKKEKNEVQVTTFDDVDNTQVLNALYIDFYDTVMRSTNSAPVHAAGIIMASHSSIPWISPKTIIKQCKVSFMAII